MSGNKALVAGALGIVGRNLAENLVALGGWEVVGISRGKPAVAAACRMLQLDLADAAACREAMAREAGVTHLFYAARALNPDAALEAEINLRMLVNLVEALERTGTALRHVCLVHGGKWYGVHLGPYSTPAREDDARHIGPNFYFDQYDHVNERQKGKAWTWSTVRPHTVCGYSLGYPHNIVAVLGAYAAISRELGLPLRFPGTRGCFDAISQATDVRLLAKAMAWVATDPGCANETFNIVNGDVFRWRNLWPKLARYFGMEDGGVQTISMAKMMAGKEAAWKAIVAKYGLRALRLEQIANWAYGDMTLCQDWDHIYSANKARRFGFNEFADSEAMFIEQFDRFRAERVLP